LATVRSFGQSLLDNQTQVSHSAHLGQEDDLGDAAVPGLEDDETNQTDQFINIIENLGAMASTRIPQQRPGPPSTLVSILYLVNQKQELNVLDSGALTAFAGAGPSRPESAPNEPDSSPGVFALLRAAALSAGSFLLAALGGVLPRSGRRLSAGRPMNWAPRSEFPQSIHLNPSDLTRRTVR
jgi:hypothetical protein